MATQARITILTVTDQNFEALLPLIAAYQVFYRARPDEARNREHFSKFLHEHNRGVQFMATDEGGKTVAFATLYFNFSSVSAAGLCVLNDLYTVPELRGQGIARALIAHATRHAAGLGYKALFWFPQDSNGIAQRLYDRYPGATKTAWLRYSVPS